MGMIRARMQGLSETGAADSHENRPWVYFMIDCFMLIVSFLILNFKFKVDDAILPQKLPPGAYPPGHLVDSTQKTLPIHVLKNETGAKYEIYTRECSQSEMNETLANMVSCGKKVEVRVSYESDVPWNDVIAVFNACAKHQIKECGMVPLRGDASVLPAPSRGP